MQYAPVPRGACSAPHTRKRVHFPLGLRGLNFLPGSGLGLVYLSERRPVHSGGGMTCFYRNLQ